MAGDGAQEAHSSEPVEQDIRDGNDRARPWHVTQQRDLAEVVAGALVADAGAGLHLDLADGDHVEEVADITAPQDDLVCGDDAGQRAQRERLDRRNALGRDREHDSERPQRQRHRELRRGGRAAARA